MKKAVFLSMIFMFLVACEEQATTGSPQPESPTPVETPRPEPISKPEPPKKVVSVEEIKKVASGSKCSKIFWKDRGIAKPGYFEGMALTFAKASCSPSSIVSRAKTGDLKKDAMSWMDAEFKAAGLQNDTAGKDTHRHAWTFLIGLGMRESSGRYCVGRDMSANFSTADSAEAGLFQSSWGAKRVAPETLKAMFDHYKANKKSCFLDVFKAGQTCSESNLKNWGTGDGMEFQKLSKECPAFSANYASILIRLTGGEKGEYGPIRKKAVEIMKSCDDMLLEVQKLVESDQTLCDRI